MVRPAVPCTVFQAYIRAPEGNLNLPITVHKSAKTSSLPTGTASRSSWATLSDCYEIHFIPHTSGVHWLNVSLNHASIVDSPCRLTVRPSSATKPVATSGQGLFHAYMGESSQFFVSKSPKNPSSIEGTFSVGVSGPSTVFLAANETPHGYEVTPREPFTDCMLRLHPLQFNYKPTRTGRYIITIKNGGQHIQGSPFICRVFSKLICEDDHFSLRLLSQINSAIAIRRCRRCTKRTMIWPRKRRPAPPHKQHRVASRCYPPSIERMHRRTASIWTFSARR